MAPYWILFFLFIALALFVNPHKFSYERSAHVSIDHQNLFYLKWIIVFILTFFIGFRYEVGGDWLNYKEIYFSLANKDLLEAILLASDPLFGLMNWLSSKLFYSDWSSYGPINWTDNKIHGYVIVNILSAFIFSIGLVRFCFSLPRPLLGIVIAIPYLIIVVSMGYVRQGAALGIIMYGITLLNSDQLWKFIFLTLIAALIHKASLIMLPMIVFVSTKNRFLIFLGITLLAIISGIILLESYIERVFANYIDAERASSGAIFRLGMLIPPSLIFLYYQSRFPFNRLLANFWRIISIGSIILFVMLFVGNFSTFIDRIALFFLPLQIAIFCFVPDIFPKKYSAMIVIGIVIYCGMTQFAWLNFAVNSWAWIPYENILLIEYSDISYGLDPGKKWWND